MAQISVIKPQSVERTRPSRSPAAAAWQRLRRSPSAVIGGVVLIIMVFSALFAPVLSPYDPIKTNQRTSLQAPNIEHPMGTDRFGRDILARVLRGGQISLPVGFISVVIAAVIGVAFGLLAGYYGGWVDSLIMRVVDLLLAFPGILLALAIVAILGDSLVNLMIAVGVSSIPDYVRITRGTVLSVREREYVQAARTVGCSDRTILLRHILPNVLAPLIILSTLGIASAIITASALSFLGLGIKPPVAEWGNMLAEGRGFLQRAWWVAFFPGLAIMVTVFSINLLGDGLRDALDPRMRG